MMPTSADNIEIEIRPELKDISTFDSPNKVFILRQFQEEYTILMNMVDSMLPQTEDQKIAKRQLQTAFMFTKEAIKQVPSAPRTVCSDQGIHGKW